VIHKGIEMKVRIACAAALLSSCGAFAQSGDLTPLAPVEEIRTAYPMGYPPGYSSRVVGTVYNNGGDAGTNTNGVALGTSSWGDEMDFSVGPWATAGTRLATTIRVWIQATCTAPPAPYDLLIDFWADANHDYNTDPMVTGTPLASLRVQGLTGTCGVQSGWDINLTGLPGGGVSIPSNAVFIQYRIVDPATTILRAPATVLLPVFGIGTVLVGQSSPSYFRDINADQVLNGGTPVIVGAGAGHEHRRTNATLNTNQRGRLLGDIPPPPIPPNTNLGAIPDAGLIHNNTIASGEVKWFGFSINGDATDAALHFLDVSSEGTGATNVSFGLYRPDGGLVAFDLDDGSASNAQLTFGVGRRDLVVDGRQYDGRDGQPSAGTYYLAVASGNATFADAFTVNNIGTDAGSLRLNFATNTNGATLAGSATPAGENLVDNGIVLAPGVGGTLTTVPRQDILWWKFTVCDSINSGGPNYLDVDLSGSTASADSEAFVFNSSGNLIASDDDSGSGLLSQLSFGNTGPRAPIGGGDAVSFAGQNGSLDPGTYYLAVGLFNTAELPSAATAGRFHLRSNSGSTLGVKSDMYTNVAVCPPPCGSADFNCDDDVGTDSDIEAFFACLGGNCPNPPCPNNADFNGDGDTGTDADIEAFFRVLAGGNC